MRRAHRPALCLWLCGALLPVAAAAQTESRLVVATPKGGARAKAPAPASQDKGAPKLVVLVVADQFRAENLRRYAPWFSAGGFQRLLGRSAVATGHYGQQNTYTGPGHAMIATGSYGYLSGVTQNKFFNRRTGRSEAMMFDPDASVLGDKQGGPEEETSPRNLIGSTLGDQLRLLRPEAKVVSVALKGRGSILLGGHLGTAYWFSDQSGTMTTSTYYTRELPEWARRWNARKPADATFGKKWERLLPEKEYAAKDDQPTEMDVKGLGRTFPHAVTGKLSAPGPAYYEALTHTAFGLDLQMDFVAAALDGENLGRRGTTDLLGVSVSATDLVGHAFGPDSQEYQDIVLRLDRALATLQTELDKRFRPGEVLLLFTADHGAVSAPEWLAAQKLAAGRIKKATIKAAVNKALADRFGVAGEWVIAAEDPSLYLDEKLVQKAKASQEEAEEVAGRAALSLPGVIGYFTRTQLLRGWLPPTEGARAVSRSYSPLRGGEVVLVTAPFYFWGKYGEKDQGSTHGSFYRYDTDVPVVLSGPWFQPGQHGTIEMVDVAATLAQVLGLTPPAACEGRPVEKMLR